jgi:uncharacterized membrane protein
VLTVVALWILFAGSHVGLAAFREELVRRIGERGFYWGFLVVAALTFGALAVGYSFVRYEGPPGFALGLNETARVGLMATAAFGVVLMVGALAPSGYWEAPIAVDVTGMRPAVGLERITRHPFMTGIVLLMGAHALLATRLTGTIFFAGFVFLAIVGSWHQGIKLRRRRGDDMVRYYEATSAIPFVAILRGKQRLVLRELPWLTLLFGVGAAVGLRHVHAGILAYHGAPLALAAGGGGFVIAAIGTWRARKNSTGSN